MDTEGQRGYGWNRAGGSGWIGGEGSGIDRYAQRKADDGFFEAEEKAVGVGGLLLLGAQVPWKKQALQMKQMSFNLRVAMII